MSVTPPPNADASLTDLEAHFRRMNAAIASMPHNEALHACLSCGLMDENVVGKKYDRYRFCSAECEAAMTTFEGRQKAG